MIFQIAHVCSLFYILGMSPFLADSSQSFIFPKDTLFLDVEYYGAPLEFPDPGSIQIDSNMSYEEAIAGADCPIEVLNRLVLISVQYTGFDGLDHQGQLLVHEELAVEVRAIFSELHRLQFPIEKVIPISAYQWSDAASMADNNSSCFNYRNAVNSDRLSKHAAGRAIDINPMLNPYQKGNQVLPLGAEYHPDRPGTLVRGSAEVRAFTSRGWRWGGSWRTLKDYQHFDK